MGGEWGVAINYFVVSFWGGENVLNSFMVMVAQFCEYGKNYLNCTL